MKCLAFVRDIKTHAERCGRSFAVKLQINKPTLPTKFYLPQSFLTFNSASLFSVAWPEIIKTPPTNDKYPSN